MRSSAVKTFFARVKAVVMRLYFWALIYCGGIFIWCASEGVALAKKKRPAVPASAMDSSQADYVFSYTLVILSIALGMMLVCRPTRRALEPKQKGQFEEL